MTRLLIAIFTCVLELVCFADASYYSSYYYRSYYYNNAVSVSVGLAIWVRILIGVLCALAAIGVGIFVLIYMCCCEKKKARRRVNPADQTAVFTVSSGDAPYPQSAYPQYPPPNAMIQPPPYAMVKPTPEGAPPAYNDPAYPPPPAPYPPVA